MGVRHREERRAGTAGSPIASLDSHGGSTLTSHETNAPTPRLRVSADADATPAGLARAVRSDARLHETGATLHPGLAVGLLIHVAALADHFGAPPTAVDAQLLGSVAAGSEVVAAIRSIAAARTDVRLLDRGATAIDGVVELAGHDVAPQVADLQHLDATPLQPPETGHLDCWVCGAARDDGLGLAPRFDRGGAVVVPWVPDDDTSGLVTLGGVDATPSSPVSRRRPSHPVDVVDPAVIVAALTCPARWATVAELGWVGARAAELTHLHVRFFRHLEVLAPVRVVARRDAAPTVRTRAAMLDEDGLVYAVGAAEFTPVGSPQAE